MTDTPSLPEHLTTSEREALFPLPDPATAATRFSVRGRLPALTGDRDICLQFTSPTSDPYYAVERMQLTETR